MKKLTLQIKRHFLEQILSGEKKEEYREIRPKNAKKYIEYYEDGLGELFAKPLAYTHIQFYNGYAKDRPAVLIEVKNAEIQLILDENGEEIAYEEAGEEYLTAQMVYTLGKVIERKNI